MSSDESSSSEEDNILESVPAIPADDEADAVVVSAIVVNDQEDDRSDDSDNDENSNNAESFSDEEAEDEDTSIACAVVVSADVGNGSTPKKALGAQRNNNNNNNDTAREIRPGPLKGRKRKRSTEKNKDGQIPSVKDLGIPFRAIKRIMKIDADIATVQNEAAIVTTYALELFVKKIVNESYANAQKRGRNTVKYEDLAETRATNKSLNFLDTLLP
jgi:histone H3/H4